MRAMTLRLPDDVHEALRREAFERRTSIQSLIEDAIALRNDSFSSEDYHRVIVKLARTEVERDTLRSQVDTNHAAYLSAIGVENQDTIAGHWSNGDPVHLIVDGEGNRTVAPNHNGATWITGGE